MAPVTVKRKSMRFLAPMPKELQVVSQEILKKSPDHTDFLQALQRLSNVAWTLEKGDLFQWIPVLDILDAELAKADSANEMVLESLRCCRTLLENCSNRHVFNSYEHLQRLLESDNCDIIMAVLRILSVLSVPRSTRQSVADAKFTSKLSTLAASWGAFGGTGEQVLTITSCCLESVDQLMSIGTTVHLETYKVAEAGDKDGEGVNQADHTTAEEGVAVIHIEQVHTLKGTEACVFEEILGKYSVPKSSHFDLKTRLRLARAFPDVAARRQWARIQIVALTVLAQCQSSGGPNPPMLPVEGCIVELIELLQHPGVPLDIQTLALKSLTALLSERSRQFSSLITANSTSHHGVLPSLIRKFKNLISNPPPDMKEHLRFGEGLLGLTWTFAGSNTGSVALHNAGMVHMLVPMFRNTNPAMVKFLTLAVKTIEVLMNYSQDMQQCFRELSGVSVLVDLAHDVVLRLIGESAPMDTSDGSCSGSSSESDETRYENCRLLSAILHLLSSAAAPVATTTDVRELAASPKLPALLTAIFKQQSTFGAGVFEKAAALLTEFVHQEPGCLQQFITAGVAQSFLTAITGDYPPSRGVVNAIPSALGALCLSTAGTQLVEAAKPLELLLKSLGSERVVFFLHGDCPSNLGVQLEELMRHNPSLLDSSMGGCVGLVSQIPETMASLDPSKSDMDINKHMYLITAVEFVGKLLEPLMSVAEHARSFIRRGGVKALLNILSLPDLPKNFSRTEAGKYLVLVIGRAAAQSVPEVLGDLIQRTVALLNIVGERCPLPELIETSTPSHFLEGNGEKQLLDLEMHTSLLAGVMASFSSSRGPSPIPIQEWNNAHGSELLHAATRCFIALRVAASCTVKSSGNQVPETGDSVAMGEGVDLMQESSSGQPIEVASVDRADNSEVTNQKIDDVITQTYTALSTLFSRLSTTISTPLRRRPDDRTPQQTNEKAVSVVFACALNKLLEGIRTTDSPARACRYMIEVLELFITCIFGNEESLRTRTSLNMLLLQELFNNGFVTKFARFTSQSVARILQLPQFQPAQATESGSSASEPVNSDLFQALAGCLSLVLRLLPSSATGATQYNSYDRNGALVPHPGFDGVLFASSLKVEIFDVVDPLWSCISNFSPTFCPPNLVALLLEFLIHHLKPDVAPTPATSVIGGGVPAVRYDPVTVAALMEMGFDERRVHTALDAIRSNSVELATEWLFMHSALAGDEDSEIARAMALSLQQDDVGSSSEQAPIPGTPSLPTISQQRETQTEALRGVIVDRCLDVASSDIAASASSSIPFAVADVLISMCQNEAERKGIISKLLDRISKVRIEVCAKDQAQARAGSLMHVFSILLSDSTESCKTAIEAGSLTSTAEMLRSETVRLSADSDAEVFSWVCPCLLVVGALLKYIDDVKKIEIADVKGENREPSDAKGAAGISTPDAKENSADSNVNDSNFALTQGEILVEACITFLRRKPAPLLNQAALQLLTRVTRVHRNAAHLLQSGGIQILLTCPAESAFSGQALLVGSILRHVLEDPVTLQTCMQAEIRVLLTSLVARNNGRPLSLRAFLSAAATLAQRDPLLFSRAVCACCHVTDNETRRFIHLTDKKEERSTTVAPNHEGGPRSETAALDSSLDGIKGQSASKAKSMAKAPEVSTQLIGILVEQLFVLIQRKPSAPATGSTTLTAESGAAMDTDKVPSRIDGKSDVEDRPALALTLSNILRFLTELVKYFGGCSHALIKCSVPSKSRVDGSKRNAEGLLAFLLCELLPGHTDMKGAEALMCAQRASQLIVALFGRGSDVRKKVVAEIVKAIQQPSAMPSRGVKTGHMQRLQSIGDLLSILLSPSKNNQVVGHVSPETAKFFLDASLPSTISAALSSMDLQHPMAAKVANALLRPLDQLCAVPVSSSRHRVDASDLANASEHPSSASVEGESRSRAAGRDLMNRPVPTESARTAPPTTSGSDAMLIDGALSTSTARLPTEEEHMGMGEAAAAEPSRQVDDGTGREGESSMLDAQEAASAAENDATRAADHGQRASQGDLNRLMAVLRHMERGNGGMDEDESEGSDEHGVGEDEEDHDDDDGSDVEEESTLDVDEESEEDEEDDDEDDGIAEDQEHGVDFLAEDLFSNDPHAHEDVGISWPRSNEIVINSEQELDHLMQRVMQNPQLRMTRNWGADIVEAENIDQEVDGDGQVLGFWMPGPGGRAVAGHGNPASLQDMFQDMHVIQFPGRVSRGLGSAGGAGAVRVAVQEGAAGAHPLLSRAAQISSRSARGGSSRSRVVGGDDYRAMFQPTQAPGLLLSQLGGRLFFGDPNGQGAGRDDGGVDAGWSRWTDDGGGSTTAMRNVALALESSIQSILASVNRNADHQAASSSSANVVDMSTSQVDGEGDSERNVRAEEVAAALVASMSAEASTIGEASALSARAGEIDGDTTAQSGMSTDAPVVADDDEGNMPEDEDELALALRLSMESDAAASSGAVGNSSVPAAPATSSTAPSGAQDEVSNAGGRDDPPADASAPRAASSQPESSTTPSVPQESLPPQTNADRASASEGTFAGTDSTIDAAFLAELPDELRAEVIAQQNGTRWSQAQPMADGSSLEDGIDPEFLAALPPDIQADVLRQHQRAQASASVEPANVGLAGEMDNGSFIATLSAELREEVLLTADDAFLASLPPHLAAEAALLRERAYHAAAARAAPLLPPSFGGMGSRRGAPAGAAAARAPVQDVRSAAENTIEARQVLSTGSEKSIVRLVELPTGVNKGLLHSVLLHLCAHASTRPPTVRLLLAQALAPALAELELSSGGVTFSAPVVGLARRALEALCHVTAQQPMVAPLLLDRGLLADTESTPTPAYTGKGKSRADARTDRVAARSEHVAGSAMSLSDKAESNALDKMLARLAAPDVIKSAGTLDLLAQLILATLVPSKPAAANSQADAAHAVPVLGEVAFRSLAVALGVLGAGRQTGERLMGALQALCGREENRKVCVPLLLEYIRKAAADCRQNLASLGSLDPQGHYDWSVESGETSHADLRLLRLAKTLRSVWTAASTQGAKSSEAADTPKEGAAGSSKDNKIDTVVVGSGESLSTVVGEDSLWTQLSTCLSAIEAHQTGLAKAAPVSSLSPALSRLQPLVEAYFVLHSPIAAQTAASATVAASPSIAAAGGSTPSAADGGSSSRSRSNGQFDSSPTSSEAWIEFAERHRNALNSYLRQDKSLLQAASTFAGLVAFPKLLDFDNKKAYFRSELKRRNTNQRHGTLRISVRREFVLEDSFHQMALRRPDELKGRLHVTFQGEEGVDAGGLSREWFLTLSKQMLNPDKALFLPSVNGLTFQPNPASGIQPDHLGYFKFAGQAVAKALWDEQLLDAHFTLSLYKHILNQPIEVKDVESIDPEYYRNLGWMLENDITNILEETFSIVREQFGEMLTIDLKPGGRNMPVTEANKHEYVQLVAEHVMTKGIRDQVEALKQGFHELIPADLIQIFSPQELELLLCGLPSIDVEDLRANTDYTGYTRDSPQIVWFWSIVEGLSQEDLARLLQFVTGTSQVPMEGFQALRGMNGAQRFNIHRCGDSGRLPSSHTCFNQLDLPEYPSLEVLQRCLLSAVREGFEGFGFS